jgi:hypothetical protein
MFCVADDVFVHADWRRLHDHSTHTRGCFWFEQRRCDGRFGQGKIVCVCCVAVGCVREATAFLIHLVVESWGYDVVWRMMRIVRRYFGVGMGWVVTFGMQFHSCALSSGGAVSCWGNNERGQVILRYCCLCGLCFVVRGGARYCVAADVFVCAAWRRLNDESIYACGCCWFEQWRYDDFLWSCKIVCESCLAFACMITSTAFFI